MAQINLTPGEIDYIARVVETEVPRSIARRDPFTYQRMVGAVVDTITNRKATGRFGDTITDVLNERRAFSKITGPARLNPYGSVENTPRASRRTQQIVNEHLGKRKGGLPSTIGGALHYANPYYSDKKNLRSWVSPMIAAGAIPLGLGKAMHFHGTAPGQFPAPPTEIETPAGFMPSIDPGNMTYYRDVPTPQEKPSPPRPDNLTYQGPDFSAIPFGPIDGVRRASLPGLPQAPMAPAGPSLSPVAPSMSVGPSPMQSAPLAPSAESIVPGTPTAAAYAQLAQGLQKAGVNLAGTPLGMPSLPTPNMPAPMPAAPPVQQPVSLPPPTITRAPVTQPISREMPAYTPPSFSSAADVYSGIAERGKANDGSIVGRDPFGMTSVTNRYGVTTAMTPQGKQSAYGPGPNLGNIGSLFSGPASGGLKGMGGAALAGGMAGSLIGGPIGGLLGAMLGRSMLGDKNKPDSERSSGRSGFGFGSNRSAIGSSSLAAGGKNR